MIRNLLFILMVILCCRSQYKHMNRRRKFLLASVLDLQNSSFVYPSCQKCYSRIILVSKRFNCPKCGSTGEAENASYRYKLSLKVAESNKLFVITVFGSCLDTFFGLTATALHRYMQHLSTVPKILDNDTTQNLLTEAVETCFLGQSFVFGVMNFEKQCGHGLGSGNFLQQCHDHRREVQALVASQLVQPDTRVSGFTVIDYFQRLLQTSHLNEPKGHLLAVNHSSSALSSIPGSDSTSYLLESHNSNNFSRFWQPSLELTSFVSQLAENGEFSISEQSMAIGTLPQNSKCTSFAEIAGAHSGHDPIQGSWSFVSHMDKNNTAGKMSEELDLKADPPNAVHRGYPNIGVTDSTLPPIQEYLEPSNTESFLSAVQFKSSHSPYDQPHHQHFDVDTTSSLRKKSTCCPPSSPRPEETAGYCQDCDSMIWDDLPLSESLNKFLAVIESEITVTSTDAKSRKRAVVGSTHKCYADHSGSSVTLQIPTGATPPVSSSLDTNVKKSSNKDNHFSNCAPSASIQKDLYQHNTADPVSLNSNESDISKYFLSKTYLSAQSPPSQDLETTVILKKSFRILSHRDEVSLRPRTSESDHSYISAGYLNGCEESHLERNERLAALRPKKYNEVSGLCELEKKQYYRWSDNQGDSFTVCKRLTYPLETLCSSPKRSTNTLKEMPCVHTDTTVTQSSSADLNGSYDASADLFDNIAKNMDATTEITERPQDALLPWETSLGGNYPAESDFLPRSLSANSSQSSQTVFVQRPPASRYPGTCSPPPHLQSDSDNDVEDSQDFVPCSQSTPVAGFHRTRIHGINGTFRNLTAFYCNFDANYKKIKVPPENDKQQIIPGCPKKFKTPTQKSRSHIMSGITPPEDFSHSPVPEYLETDSGEWVPPTTQKALLSDMLGFQDVALRRCRHANNPSDQNELPRKKWKHVKQRAEMCSVKKELKNRTKATDAKQKTPKYNSKRSVWNSKESVLGLGSFSEVRCRLPFSENCPPFMAESTWSPELFS
ncbi:DNA damage-induced apoptosis suppressor protein [Perognathus longimembris pacificus]|uniref:DNA damage-induced apoptosis suppressor protein n=1 Tax=Perognathus longimembris pacificus TaxID=214514 RepID=UPI002019903C|nr:DNA damage-induced apoptosis suppressor protein [Perognathus longimembris pacificus]